MSRLRLLMTLPVDVAVLHIKSLILLRIFEVDFRKMCMNIEPQLQNTILIRNRLLLSAIIVIGYTLLYQTILDENGEAEIY